MNIRTRTLAALAAVALVGCVEDAPEELAGPNRTEIEAVPLDPGKLYAATRADAPPCFCRPMRVEPRYFRFESELAKQRFLAEVIGPPAPGKIVGFRPVDAANPNFSPVFLDVRIRLGDRRIETELIASSPGRRRLPMVVWEPENARREEDGMVWTH